jgi:hypothetical protein
MIIGAAHFPDTAAGPGLVNLLRDAGYQLSVVQNRAALALLLNKLPAVRPRQQLPESKEWIVDKLDGSAWLSEVSGYADGPTVGSCCI